MNEVYVKGANLEAAYKATLKEKCLAFKITDYGLVAVLEDNSGYKYLDIQVVTSYLGYYFMRRVKEGSSESLRLTKGIPPSFIELLDKPLYNNNAMFRNIVKLINID